MATLRAATGGDENRCATACRRGLASAVFRGQLSWSQLIDFKLDIGGPFPRTRDYGAPQPTLEGMKTDGSADLAARQVFGWGVLLLSRPIGGPF